MAEKIITLPIIDLSTSDPTATAKSIHQACVECGFFYLVNHGIEDELFTKVFEESKKFFSLPLHEKLKLTRKEHRGYTPLYAEKLDPSLTGTVGDSKEGFYIGPMHDLEESSLNQWPSQEVLPSWRPTMISYHEKAVSAGRRLISLIALALNLDESFFEKIGALRSPSAFMRLLRYPGEPAALHEEAYGASAHSDYGMITLLATDGVRGLQACLE
ncbi:hypothetical protein IFM89_030584 [Coptis chinensis]|uniref:Non-haem dioxygenase N-terminal domain-containing protein n=1 Tax=Coptis chinensis TaxID=261450 RepID=A0A835LX54_9MAGN|nr:hypothetical protein IFM89_030584 [Coptis chinensis]